MRTGPKIKPLGRDEREIALVDRFFSEGLGPRTVNLYMTAIRQAEAWCVANGFELATLHVQGVIDLSETMPRTWSSRRRLRSALKHYWEAVGRDNAPVKAIRVPTKPVMISKALEDTSARKLAAVARARNDRKGAAVLIGLYLGLRRAEIAALRWANFHDEDLSWITFVGKGDVTASLPVHPNIRRILQAIRRPGEWVFPGSDSHISPPTVWHWVRQVANDAGLGLVPTHVLRHTCLTTANDQTGDLRAVQAFARHSRPETTAGYTRVNALQLVRVMDSLNYDEEAS